MQAVKLPLSLDRLPVALGCLQLLHNALLHSTPYGDISFQGYWGLDLGRIVGSRSSFARLPRSHCCDPATIARSAAAAPRNSCALTSWVYASTTKILPSDRKLRL
jgi:hypothetical protein